MIVTTSSSMPLWIRQFMLTNFVEITLLEQQNTLPDIAIMCVP
jgi:hypothetical protein